MRKIEKRQTRLEGLAHEQVALRRVATLIAREAAPEEVFAAVTAQAGRVLGADVTHMMRYEPDGAVTVAAAWTSTAAVGTAPVGSRWELGRQSMSSLVFETGRSARIDNYAEVSGPAADLARERGIRSGVGVPINVAGRLWGLMAVGSTQEEPLPADTEARLAGFTELVVIAMANAQARVELRGFAEEQAALQRVAMLVARAAPPREVFAAVTAEAGQLLGCDFTLMNRYDPDQMVTAVGAWGRTDAAMPLLVGHRAPFEGPDVSTRVFRTCQPERIDQYGPSAGCGPAPFVAAEIRSVVGVPIGIEGRLWGVMLAMTREQPVPADTEARLAGFTELVAAAIANAESQAQLTASRARIVAAADHARRRIERDLHDGAQQRLVSLALKLRAVKEVVPPDAGELRAQLNALVAEATSTLDELRELARGIHPAILGEGGLRPALKALARRCTVPVELDARVDGRLPEQIEIAAYYVVSEALTNAAKHAHASIVHVEVDAGDAVVVVGVRDDGRGGADLSGGSGLVGLKDRVEALRGRLSVHSAPGAGTCVRVELPLGPHPGFS
ncbi:MAG: GAF domain-containing protein [Pseudonocardia sp.]|nr:GAF domain-containing protein [Pseudonocardia sp.]